MLRADEKSMGGTQFAALKLFGIRGTALPAADRVYSAGASREASGRHRGQQQAKRPQPLAEDGGGNRMVQLRGDYEPWGVVSKPGPSSHCSFRGLASLTLEVMKQR